MANRTGITKTVNGQKKKWDGRRWVPVGTAPRTTRTGAPGAGRSRASRNTTTRTSTASKPTTRTPRQAMNADMDSSYRVAGITYDRSTGRPIDVPENRKPVVAKAPPKKTPPKTTPPKPTPRAASASDAQNLRQGRSPDKPASKPRTWLADNYKSGGPSNGRRSTPGKASNKPKQSARMRDALKNLKVRKY